MKNRRNLKIAGIIGFILVVLITAFIVSRAYEFIFPIQRQDDSIEQVQEDPLTEEDFLHTEGAAIVNQNGERLILTGINLGGWLIQEYWMCPVQGDRDTLQWTNLQTLDTLEERFGREKTQELLETYQDNWITEWDIQRIASFGANCIRVPFWYRNFMWDDEGTWMTEDLDDNPGIRRLDWVIETAKKYGMYVVLDMHGCPGGQTWDHTSGSTTGGALYTEEKYQRVMEELWTAIADRYKDEPAVAAYDIMNEPQVRETPASIAEDPRNHVYDRMIKAIRAVDSRHMIAVEAMWSLDVLPTPQQAGWTNVIYELHSYGDDVDGYCYTAAEYSNTNGVPVYIGEFSDMDMWETCFHYGISCTSWTYKGSSMTEDTWFVYYDDRSLDADVLNDPYWLIKLKWGKRISTIYYKEDFRIVDAVIEAGS